MVLVQKCPFFHLFFFRKYTPGECLLRHSRTKNACLGYKKKSSKSRKIDMFPKVQKWPFVKLFFFQQYRQEKYILRYSRTKKRLSCFYSLERPFFVLEYRKRHFYALYCLRKKLEQCSFLDQNQVLTSLEKWQFFDFLNFLFL